MSDPDDPNDESNDTEIRFFNRVLVEQIQELTDAAAAVKIGRWLDFAVGATLDQAGRLVSEKRGGQLDDPYRRTIKAKVAALRSKTRIEDLIGVARLVVSDSLAHYAVALYAGMAVTVKINDVVVAVTAMKILVRMLRIAVGAGVRCNLEFWTATPRFHFKRFDGAATAGTGFKSFDGTTGGHLGWAFS